MKTVCSCDEESGLRKGPWTLEEDTLLQKYIACYGEGRWNLVAKSAGLKRTGKSCRLRWLNYLKPDVKRGNLTPQEQLLILELHSKWGNRWSKIAHHLPGRTDNEIKNYWRTRVQKQARQQKFKNNSVRFVDAIRQFWAFTMLPKTENVDPLVMNSTASSLVTTQQGAPMPSPPSPSTVHSYASASQSSPKKKSSTSTSQLRQNYGITGISEPSPLSPHVFENILNSHEILNCDFPLVGESSYDMETCISSMDNFEFPTNCGIGDGDWVTGNMEDTQSVWNMDELW